MPVLDKTDEKKVDQYKEFVRNSTHRSLTQDYNWKNVKDDWGNEQVYIERDGEIVAALSLLIQKTPGGYSLLYAPRGPVCDFYDLSLVTELVNEAKEVAKKHKAFVLKMDPEVLYTDELDQKYRRAGFVVRNSDDDQDDLIQPMMNMVVDLENKDEESLMLGFKRKTRNNIRRALKKGVKTTYSREDDYLEKFYEIYKTMAERNGIATRPFDYFIKLRDSFEGLRIYLTEHEGDYLSGAITINYEGKMYYIYAGSTNEKRNLSPNHVMNYEMMKWGIEENAIQYDLGGIFSLNKEEDGLFEFKRGFFKEEEEGVRRYIGEVDYVYKPFIYKLFVKFLPMIKQLRRKLKRN
ncbi:lipid II:glycine glycyltransferase FemX [Alkalibacillus aidingensis]|uniref:lipid II:glycine glycyltransferase FemX n=1 Tax=Alkalibacillus aidingensis TaxID=2747607 RepID=UPI0016609AD5|nr:peptidoglycan bridge formation glycyltransferase FemA/FemB family protein [Alkalibacillus aidingensis]